MSLANPSYPAPSSAIRVSYRIPCAMYAVVLYRLLPSSLRFGKTRCTNVSKLNEVIIIIRQITRIIEIPRKEKF